MDVLFMVDIFCVCMKLVIGRMFGMMGIVMFVLVVWLWKCLKMLWLKKNGDGV